MKLRLFKLQKKIISIRVLFRDTAFTIFAMNSFKQKKRNIKKNNNNNKRKGNISASIRRKLFQLNVVSKKKKKKSLIFMPCHVQPRERMKSIQAEIQTKRRKKKKVRWNERARFTIKLSCRERVAVLFRIHVYALFNAYLPCGVH